MIKSLVILSVAVLILVMGIVWGNLLLTEFLITKSSEEAIQQQIKENLHNSAIEYSSAILEIFQGYSSTLEIMNRIVLSSMKKDDTIFDYNYVKEFPLIGPGPLESTGKYYNIVDDYSIIPEELEKSYEINPEDFPGVDYTLSKWYYAAFASEDHLYVSPQNQQYIEACDILNYFLEDFYFNKKVTHINAIYYAWEIEEQLMFIYPGGIFVADYENYRPHKSSWYKRTKEVWEKSENKESQMVITGPYIEVHVDETTNIKVLTISRAIVDKDKNFLGVSCIDIKVNDLEYILEKVKFYETGFLSFVSMYNDKVFNNPHNSFLDYKITDEETTGINQEMWNEIKNESIKSDEIIEQKN